MKINQSSYSQKSVKPAFGYNYETHRVITQKALEQVPEFEKFVRELLQSDKFIANFSKKPTVISILKSLSENPAKCDKYVVKMAINPGGFQPLIDKAPPPTTLLRKFMNVVADASMLPDLLKKESGFCTNRHFFFMPERVSQTSSFGPNSSQNNAFDAFSAHVKNMRKSGNKGNLPFEIGLIAHFLQDMTVSMHTQRAHFSIFKKTPLVGKAIDFYMHKNFESGKKLGMLAKHEKLVENYVPNFEKLEGTLTPNYSSYELFMSNVKFSTQKHLQVKRTNKEQWSEIQQETFNQGVDSTVLLLKSIMRSLKP